MPLFSSRLVEAERACDDFLPKAGTSGPWKREMLRRAPTVYEKKFFQYTWLWQMRAVFILLKVV
jgi:hypothetical protein